MTPVVRWLVAIAVAAFVVFLLSNAPASLVANRVAAMDPAISLVGVTGTAWRGHADQVRYGSTVVGTLDWRVSGFRLLSGQGAARFALVGPDAQLALRARRALITGQTGVIGAIGHVPLALLAELSGAHGPLDATVELDDVSFTVRGAEVEYAVGRVRLTDTTALAPLRYPLGTYVLDLDAVDGWLVGTVVEADGPLVLAGTVRLRGDGEWALNARARASQPDSELALVLSLLGEADADGYRSIVLSGRL